MESCAQFNKIDRHYLWFLPQNRPNIIDALSVTRFVTQIDTKITLRFECIPLLSTSIFDLSLNHTPDRLPILYIVEEIEKFFSTLEMVAPLFFAVNVS